MQMLRSLALAGIGWGMGAVFATAPASAGQFQLDPTRIELSEQRSSAMLTLTNQSPDAARFQVTAFSWSQSEEGEMQLEPTEDVVAYPSLIETEPGQRQRIRVGVTSAAEAREKSYRLFVEELPSGDSPEAGVNMRVRIGIPVFLAAQRPSTGAAFESAHVDESSLSFSLRNTGTRHIRLRHVSAVGRSAEGEELFRERADGWYLLPGQRRVYRRQVELDSCEELDRVTLEAKSGDRDWSRTLSPRCRDGE